MRAYKCQYCQDTGYGPTGWLDCAHCDAAEERAKFSKKMNIINPAEHVWEAYLLGKEAHEADVEKRRAALPEKLLYVGYQFSDVLTLDLYGVGPDEDDCGYEVTTARVHGDPTLACLGDLLTTTRLAMFSNWLYDNMPTAAQINDEARVP